jgi:hypothetical protein
LVEEERLVVLIILEQGIEQELPQSAEFDRSLSWHLAGIDYFMLVPNLPPRRRAVHQHHGEFAHL